MQIAYQLHYWLTETTYLLSEHALFDFGDPNDDPNNVTQPRIPPFPFADSLDVIALLPSKNAEDVFRLMERKLSAGKEANFISFVQDNQDAAELFDARIAAIIVDCVRVHSELAKQVGWTAKALPDNEVESWRERAAKLEEINNRNSGIDFPPAAAETLPDQTPNQQPSAAAS